MKKVYELDFRGRKLVIEIGELAKQEIESSKRFGVLFDAITTYNEKCELYDQKLFSLESKNFNHDIRISELEKKIC